MEIKIGQNAMIELVYRKRLELDGGMTRTLDCPQGKVFWRGR